MIQGYRLQSTATTLLRVRQLLGGERIGLSLRGAVDTVRQFRKAAPGAILKLPRFNNVKKATQTKVYGAVVIRGGGVSQSSMWTASEQTGDCV